MRVVFPAAAVAILLGACAHPARYSVAEAGEVALAPVAAPRGATFAPIALAELGTPNAPPPAARPAIATPAFAPNGTVTASPAAAHGASDLELWRGTYVGRTYGQRGALALALRPAPNGGVRGVVAWRVAPARAEMFVSTRPADSVALVRSAVVAATRDSGQLVLQLDSYFDPACNCTAHATFRGMLRGDTLVGRFRVEGAATVVGEDRGHWRAVRVRP